MLHGPYSGDGTRSSDYNHRTALPAQACLSSSPATQARRGREIAGSVPAGHPAPGRDGTGPMSLPPGRVAGSTARDPRHATATWPATAGGGQLTEPGVPGIGSRGGVVVSGEPGWPPAPHQISPRSAVGQGSDPVAQSELMNELPAFSRAYAGGDSAAGNRFLARGVSLTAPGGAVTFDSVASRPVPPGGATRQITATVIWQVPGRDEPGATELEMAYDVSVVDFQSGKWYVSETSASTEAVGAK